MVGACTYLIIANNWDFITKGRNEVQDEPLLEWIVCNKACQNRYIYIYIYNVCMYIYTSCRHDSSTYGILSVSEYIYIYIYIYMYVYMFTHVVSPRQQHLWHPKRIRKWLVADMLHTNTSLPKAWATYSLQSSSFGPTRLRKNIWPQSAGENEVCKSSVGTLTGAWHFSYTIE